MADDGRTVVFTDGACSGNPGPGGWAWAVPGGRWRAGCEARSTNQRMEVQAAFDALRTLDGPLEVVSDSTYVVNCFRDRWWDGWIKRGWKNSQKQPVANRDLWEPFIEAYRADPTRVRFRWVKGHSGDVMNDLVDKLAVKACTTQRAEESGAPPADPGPTDRMAADESALGWGLVIGGLRPPELGGYDPNPLSRATVRKLAEIIGGQSALHPDLVVLTGMGLGAEQLAAEAADAAHVPFVAVLAHPNIEARWPAATKDRYRDLVVKAREVVTVGRIEPDGPPKVAAALRRRDGWLADHASAAVVVWDREERFAGVLAGQLRDKLGEDEVWIVDPTELTPR